MRIEPPTWVLVLLVVLVLFVGSLVPADEEDLEPGPTTCDRATLGGCE